MSFVTEGRDVFMWSDEKEELKEKIREGIIDILFMLLFWSCLFLIAWAVII
jgi:hypothetical protein